MFLRRAPVLAAVLIAASASGPKTESRSAPAPHYSAPAGAPHFGGGNAGGGGGGGVHLPSNMHPGGLGGGEAGGVHLPSGMRGAGGDTNGVHLPSNMRAAGGGAGGAHVPSSMAAHGGGAAHMAAGPHYGAGAQHGAASGTRYADHGNAATRGDARSAGGAREGLRESGRESGREGARQGTQAGRHDPLAGHAATEVAQHHQERALQATRHDVRLGGTAHLNTRGLEAGLAIHQPPRPFLRANPHRDVAADRSFVSRHEGDFHTRNVRDFSARERSLWRAGLWRNEWHYGRRGWWWEVDGVWYSYPAPIWPYPIEVTPLVVYDTPVVDGPDYSVEEGIPVVAVATAAPGPDGSPPPAGSDTSQNDQNAAPNGGPGGTASDAPAGGTTPTMGATPAADTTGGPHISPLPAPPVGWYHCEGPQGFYPGLDACGNGWTLVQTPPLPGEQ
jgi:hypothetical protein